MENNLRESTFKWDQLITVWELCDFAKCSYIRWFIEIMANFARDIFTRGIYIMGKWLRKITGPKNVSVFHRSNDRFVQIFCINDFNYRDTKRAVGKIRCIFVISSSAFTQREHSVAYTTFFFLKFFFVVFVCGDSFISCSFTFRENACLYVLSCQFFPTLTHILK